MIYRWPFGALRRASLPLLLSLSLACPAPVFADDLPDLGEAARADFSPQTEKKIGESIMNDIRLHEPTYIDDAEITGYLNQLGGRLVAASTDPNGDFHFFAIRDSSVNAFAMFGGFIGVNTGTLLTAQSESELAGVMAHEISHVTQHHLARQISKEKQNSIASMIAMAVAILAARSNSQVSSAAIMSAQAGSIQSQLAYTRDFEREADRSGYQILQQSGFDVRGMGDFFERLQRAGRVYENNAPVYMRSHPLTTERISDMQNRSQGAPYRQVLDSLEFHLVRAKVRAEQGTPREAVSDFESLLKERKYASEGAAHYGLALAELRARNLAAAEREIGVLKKLKTVSPMVDNLAAEVKVAAGDLAAAQAIYRDGVARFPQSKALIYGYAEALYGARQYPETLRFLDSQLQLYAQDFKLYGLQAKAYAAAGKQAQAHRAQAELYVLQGQLGPAVEQLQLAQRAGDANFYEQSVIDARLRELKKRHDEELKQRR